MTRTVRTPTTILALAISLVMAACRSTTIKPDKKLKVTSNSPPPEFEIIDEVQEQPSMITSEGKLMKMYYTRHNQSQTLAKLINSTFPGKATKVVTHPNFHQGKAGAKSGGLDLLLVEGPPDKVDDIDNFIAMIEADVLQVEIRVRVVEVTKTNRDQWGINVAVEEVNPKNPNTLFNQATAAYTSAEYLKSLSPAGKQAGPLAFQGARFLLDTVQHDLQLDVAIELLKQYQEVEVLSAPSVRVLNGHPAYIETGERTPILTASYNAAGIVSVATTFQNTGVKLSVIPTVVAEDTIRLNVLPEVSSVTGFTDPATSGGFSVPFISTRKAETVVNVRDGEIFLLGGLYYTTELMQESKFPILGDIPILGYLFSSTNKTFQTSEILFFLQPKVIVPRSGGRGRLVLPPDELK
jgi:type II secretory pathway component GspD/PulD (secretin)